MKTIAKKLLNRTLRKSRVRAKVYGTAERPRLSVFVSNTHVSAQLINDEQSNTLASVTTVGAKVEGSMKERAAWAGAELGRKAKKLKVTKAVFDRNGRKYAGRLQSFAEAARKEGLEF